MDTVHGSRHSRQRRAGLVATGFLVAAALVMAACGTSAPNASNGSPASQRTPKAILLAAVQQTEAADSAAVTLDISVAGTPAIAGLVPAASGTAASPVSFSITGQGAFDFTHRLGQMTITVPATQDNQAGTFELRLVGTDLYFTAPQVASLDGGKPWVHVDASQYLQRQGQSAGPLGGFSDGDPTQVLSMLEQVSGAVTQVGTANVDGVPTTEYQGTIDLTKPSGGAGGGAGGTNGSSSTRSTVVSPQIAQALGLTDIPIDVWIDSVGRARRVQTSFAIFGLTVRAQEGFGSFGSPVTVTAPAPGDVADGTGLLESGQLDNLFGSGSSG